MSRKLENSADVESVPLQTAYLCIDCEFVSNSRYDACPVCGGHSLHSLARLVGGSLLEYKSPKHSTKPAQRFDLHISIDLDKVEAREMNYAIEGVSAVLAPTLARKRASLHISVNPVADDPPVEQAA